MSENISTSNLGQLVSRKALTLSKRPGRHNNNLEDKALEHTTPIWKVFHDSNPDLLSLICKAVSVDGR